MDLQVELRPITYAVFESACLALHLDPDNVMNALEVAVPPSATIEEMGGFLRAVLKDPPADAQIAFYAVLRTFFDEAFGRIILAHARSEHYADRAGVSYMGSSAEDPPALARLLVSLPAPEWHQLYHVMPLEEMLFYVLMRGIDHKARNPKQYLS